MICFQDASQNKIASLEEVLKEKINLSETLQNNLYSLKDSHCKNNVFLETYEKMRIIMKEKHRNGLDSAKILYNSCQELSDILENSKTECKANEELILKTEEKFKMEQTKFEQKHNQLVQDKNTINNKLAEEESLKTVEKEHNALLKMELDNLQKEIKQFELSLCLKEKYLTEKEVDEENKEQKIIEEFNIVDKEFNLTTENYEQLRTNHLQVINDLESNLHNIEEQ